MRCYLIPSQLNSGEKKGGESNSLYQCIMPWITFSRPCMDLTTVEIEKSLRIELLVEICPGSKLARVLQKWGRPENNLQEL